MVVAGGLVEGTALGILQAAALVRLVPALDRRRWLGVTVVVAGLGWAAASAPAALAPTSPVTAGEPSLRLVLLGAAGLGLVMGALLGTGQASAFRHHVRHPSRWVAASAAGWPPAMAVIFLGATRPDAGWSVPAVLVLGAVTGIVAGAVLGAVSGWFLPSLDVSGPTTASSTRSAQPQTAPSAAEPTSFTYLPRTPEV